MTSSDFLSHDNASNYWCLIPACAHFSFAIAVYYVINKLNKTPEQIEQEENEKYLNELKGKL